MLSCLRTRSLDSEYFQFFLLLVHRRAFRKLGWRIRETLTHWGESPFLIMQQSVWRDKVLPSKKYEISLAPDHAAILQSCEFPFSSQNSLQCWVDTENVLVWLGGFHNILTRLQILFPSPMSKIEELSIPSALDVKAGVIYIHCLVILKPIIKYILTLPGIEEALLHAGKSTSYTCV